MRHALRLGQWWTHAHGTCGEARPGTGCPFACDRTGLLKAAMHPLHGVQCTHLVVTMKEKSQRLHAASMYSAACGICWSMSLMYRPTGPYTGPSKWLLHACSKLTSIQRHSLLHPYGTLWDGPQRCNGCTAALLCSPTCTGTP